MKQRNVLSSKLYITKDHIELLKTLSVIFIFRGFRKCRGMFPVARISFQKFKN